MTIMTKKEQHYPVVEIFGPTIQGEGVDQGVPANFIRFGGCDYRCDWCDTPHAVLPDQVRQAPKLTDTAIIDKLTALESHAPWVILSGGNPALHDLDELVDVLHMDGYLVAVETQGSRWRNWMRKVDRLCVSPKPPSANEQKSTPEALLRYLHEGMEAKASGNRPYEWMFLKIPIFDQHDLDYAEYVRNLFSDALLYLSAGNDAGKTVSQPKRVDQRKIADVRLELCQSYRWLVEATLQRPRLASDPSVIVQAQMHVLAWGNERGR